MLCITVLLLQLWNLMKKKKLFDFVTGILWHVHRDTEWLIHRSRWLYEHQNKHRHAEQSRGGFFSVYLCIQKQQSSPSEHIHPWVCIHPHFFVYNTTGALEAMREHDQMNTEALISQQRENMLPYSPLKQSWTFLTLRFYSSPEWWQSSRSEPNTDNVLCSAFA